MRLVCYVLLFFYVNTVWAVSPELGKSAPTLDTERLDGEGFSTHAMLGKVVIVHFWATWCAPCREEMPVLDAFYKIHRNEGLEIIAISLDDPKDIAQVKKVMASFSFPAAMVENTKAKGYGRLWRIPLTCVIDRQGILRRNAWTAAPKVDAAVLDAEVMPLLRQIK